MSTMLNFKLTHYLVVQCQGTKEWLVYGDYTNAVTLPQQDVAWDPLMYRPLGEPLRVVLRQGDVLYVPRGVMHEAYCGPAESLHLTISIAPLTLADLLVTAIKQHAALNERFRARVPLGTGRGDFGRVGASVRAELFDLASSMDVVAMLTKYDDEIRLPVDVVAPSRLAAVAARLQDQAGRRNP